jgi:DUF1009 family protein
MRTLEVMHEAGAKALVIESGKTVVYDRREMVAYADRHGMVIVATDESLTF